MKWAVSRASCVWCLEGKHCARMMSLPEESRLGWTTIGGSFNRLWLSMFHTWQSFSPVKERREEVLNWLTCMERTVNGTFNNILNFFQVNFFFVGLSLETLVVFVFIMLWLWEEKRSQLQDTDHWLFAFLLTDDEMLFTEIHGHALSNWVVVSSVARVRW